MILDTIIKRSGKKFALLIDPDKQDANSLSSTVYAANKAQVDLILVGGSLVSDTLDAAIKHIKAETNIPVVLFPGSLMQLSRQADAILLLSLISGRNPDLLIGNHVLAAPYLKKSNLEIIPTGYILVGDENTSAVGYISNTNPIPSKKTDLIVATAMAGEMIGNQIIYLEAGSGANNRISLKTISEVKKNISIPLIVGGGIRYEREMFDVYKAGADMVVIGTAIESDISSLYSFSKVALNF
jgi:phosphoglycerol geranylgeranyltransferase